MKKILFSGLILLASLSTSAQISSASSSESSYGIEDVCGEYIIKYNVALENGVPYYGKMEVDQGETESTVVLNIPYVSSNSVKIWSVTASFDNETGQLEIKSDQPSGISGVQVVLSNWNFGWHDKTELTPNFNGSAIVFEENDAMGLQATNGNWVTRFDTIEMVKIVDDPNADPNEGWTSLGDASFYDPWLLPKYGIDQYANSWMVELQQNNEDENVYRLVNPYRGNSPVAEHNTSTAQNGYIQFSIADPQHVKFFLVDAGFANEELGITNFYCYNTLTWWSLYLGYNFDLIVSLFGNDYPSTTYNDGVVTLGKLVTVDDDTNEEVIKYDACYGKQDATNGGYRWDYNGSPADMTGMIVFPGSHPNSITDINDTKKGTPIYFNLQGVKIDKPASGIYIVVKDGKSSKIYVK